MPTDRTSPSSHLLRGAWVALLLALALPARAQDPLHGAGVTLTRLKSYRYEVTFELPHEAGMEQVAVAGSFNQWAPDKFPLARDEARNAWRGTLELLGGEYEYKFVVNRTSWRADQRNPLTASDNQGGQNSVLRLGVKARVKESRARTRDNRLQADTLVHVEDFPLYFRPLADGRVVMRLLTLANDAERVELLRPSAAVADLESADLATLAWSPYPMEKRLGDARFDYWETAIVPDTGDTIPYAFLVTDGTARVVVDASGATPNATRPARPFLRRHDPAEVFRAPDWARGVVWYQILPDRWRNGARENDPPNTRPWTAAWKKPSPWEIASGQSFYDYYAFDRVYGGDLQGVLEKLPYLNQIGVTGIYLNPIWMSHSPHGYDVIDFRHVEPRLAVVPTRPGSTDGEELLDAATWRRTPSDDLFLKVLAEAKKRGIRVVVDAAFNHSGNEHPAFRDVVANGRRSRYRNWYEVTSWEPFTYEGWGGFGKLPVFKEDRYGFVDSALRQHLLDVTRRWMDPDGDGDPSDGVDGWRLDAANEVSPYFWAEWRAHVKAINPDALIIGEVWERPDPYLSGDQFDGVTNYSWAMATVEFFFNRRRPTRPSEFDALLAELRISVPDEANFVQWNLVDSHDTDRVLSMALNPDRPFDRRNKPQGDGTTYDESRPGAEERARYRLLLAFQMTYVGAPLVYYGSEVGMFGADDPNNRQPMLWDDLGPHEDADATRDEELLAAFQRLVAIRNTWACFRRGSYRTLLADDRAEVFAFARQGEAEAGVVVLNRSAQPREIALPVGGLADAHGPVRRWVDVLRERDVTLFNSPAPTGQGMRRHLRLNRAYPIETRADGTLPVKLEPLSAAIYVSSSAP